MISYKFIPAAEETLSIKIYGDLIPEILMPQFWKVDVPSMSFSNGWHSTLKYDISNGVVKCRLTVIEIYKLAGLYTFEFNESATRIATLFKIVEYAVSVLKEKLKTSTRIREPFKYSTQYLKEGATDPKTQTVSFSAFIDYFDKQSYLLNIYVGKNSVYGTIHRTKVMEFDDTEKVFASFDVIKIKTRGRGVYEGDILQAKYDAIIKLFSCSYSLDPHQDFVDIVER